MKRGGRLRPRGDTAYARRDRNFDFMGWVKHQRCAVAEELGSDAYCSGGFAEADHAGRHGLGQKCADDETIPMCNRHHRERTDRVGYFKGWPLERVRAWLDGWITKIRDRYARLQAAGPLPF
jgi:hypothetical protein